MRLRRRRLEVHQIDSATRLSVRPGDTVVLATNDDLDQHELASIKARTEELLPGVRCLVMTGGLSLRAVLYEGGREAA